MNALPNEVLTRIFKFLHPIALDDCKCVCRRWKHVIENFRSELAFHQIDTLRFTFQKEFRIYLDYGQVKSCMRSGLKASNEYVCIKFVFSKPTCIRFRQLYGQDLVRRKKRYKPSCNHLVYRSIAEERCLTTHHRILSEELANLQKSAIEAFFWTWLLRVLSFSTSEVILFSDMFFTSTFIRQLLLCLRTANGGKPYVVKKLIVHGCHVAPLCSADFQAVFFDLIRAEEYMFACLNVANNAEFVWQALNAYRHVSSVRLLHFSGAQLERDDAELLSDDYMLNILLKNDGFKSLTSIQFSGLKLSALFIEKYIKVSLHL